MPVTDNERGAVVREPSKLVLFMVRDDPETRKNLGAITDSHKKRFRQQSVLISLRTIMRYFLNADHRTERTPKFAAHRRQSIFRK